MAKRTKKPQVPPVEELLAAEVPESAEGFVGQARSFGEQIARINEQMGGISEKIEVYNKALRDLQKDHDVAALRKKRNKLQRDRDRLHESLASRAVQMTIPFSVAG